LKNRQIQFTAPAQEHVRREKAWWLTDRDHPGVFTEELEQALQIIAVLPGAGTLYAQSAVPGVPHDVRNGVFLRADLHRLFDQGYVTISTDQRLEVSPRLRVDYQNGRSYYPLHGSQLSLPSALAEAPASAFLRWHNENVYRTA
jgi:hypothetical protein